MKQLTVISGKGGTGKTSITASFAALAPSCVIADCDVDAADLHLVLDPVVRNKEQFSGGSLARVMPGHCVACGKCAEVCMFDAVFYDGPGNGKYPRTFRIDPVLCEGCGVCAWFCADNAIEFKAQVNGEWFISESRNGPLIHAKLGIAEENSGKLVTTVRKAAVETAEQTNADVVIIDGSPGIGCPVISSIAGVDYVLIVTEPTRSGMHDLKRVLDLAAHFDIQAGVVVNKWDINKNITEIIEKHGKERGADILGRIRYDRAVTDAMVQKLSIVEHDAQAGASADISSIWSALSEKLK